MSDSLAFPGLPAGWRDGHCPECGGFVRSTVAVPVDDPPRRRVECLSCDAAAFVDG